MVLYYSYRFKSGDDAGVCFYFLIPRYLSECHIISFRINQKVI